jgi:hypothetical protein
MLSTVKRGIFILLTAVFDQSAKLLQQQFSLTEMYLPPILGLQP